MLKLFPVKSCKCWIHGARPSHTANLQRFVGSNVFIKGPTSGILSLKSDCLPTYKRPLPPFRQSRDEIVEKYYAIQYDVINDLLFIDCVNDTFHVLF